ncbi:MAG: tRNA-intron lyase [Thermoplasmata archaeon]
MAGRVVDDHVIVDDQTESSQIYNRGWYGIPQSGGSLQLDLIEALYLLETERLVVKLDDRPLDFIQLMRLGNKSNENFEIRYLVYRDLRGRGYVVKSDGGLADFRVFPRGGSPSRTASKWWVLALSERSLFELDKLLSSLISSRGLRKDLLLAIVDEEGDVTYYEVRRASPSGKSKRAKIDGLVEGLFTGDRVLISDSAAVKALHESQAYGKLMGEKLQLSLIEASYLADSGQLVLKNSRTGRRMDAEQLKRYARKTQRDFDLRLRAYQDLRKRGLIVKTGFKYGSHFRAYEGDPNRMHARFLIHAVPEGYVALWPEISRAIRLAHGVRKEILFCKVGDEEVDYIKLMRCRP